MNDLYSKAVMTVIAVALTVIAGNQLFGPAQAQSDCGDERNPCYIALPEKRQPWLDGYYSVEEGSLNVKVINWPDR